MDHDALKQVLDYGRTDMRPQPRARVLGFFANVAWLYPVVPLAALYGEWVLAGLVLGHAPASFWDDPKSISGSSWAHGITALALLTMKPVALVTIAFNAAYAAYTAARWGHWKRAAVRLLTLVALWAAAFFVLWWDPAKVLYWWND